MTSTKPEHVAIIGAGPAGLLLSFCLARQGIRATVYEAHGKVADLGVGVVLSPNGLRILDQLGLYERLVPQSFEWEATHIVNEAGDTLERHYYGHKAIYGYKALRTLRRDLTRELISAVEQLPAVTVHYHSRYEGIVSDDADTGVSFTVNGETKHADMLVGADGIHSSIRAALDSTPLKYSGILGIGCPFPRNEVAWPPNFPSAATVLGKGNSMVLIPEDHDGTTTLGVTSVFVPERTRAQWAALNADKPELVRLLRERYAEYGTLNRGIIDALSAHPDKLFIWPFYSVPRLAHWASPSRRVLLLGDAAHAIPPSSGQGVNQAFEDAASLAKFLAASTAPRAATVDAWHAWRQKRVDEVTRMVEIMNIKRMPKAQRDKLPDVPVEDLESAQEGEGAYAWLYNVDVDKEVARELAAIQA